MSIEKPPYLILIPPSENPPPGESPQPVTTESDPPTPSGQSVLSPEMTQLNNLFKEIIEEVQVIPPPKSGGFKTARPSFGKKRSADGKSGLKILSAEQEAYCTFRALGFSPIEAYRKVYKKAKYKWAGYYARKMESKPHIEKRIGELRLINGDTCHVYAEEIIHYFREIRRQAFEQGELGFANSANLALAKVAGILDKPNRDKADEMKGINLTRFTDIKVPVIYERKDDKDV